MQYIEELMGEHPELAMCERAVRQAVEKLGECFAQGGKLLVCGNGGSCADAGHIVGELMKGFRRARPVPDADARRLARAEPALGPALGEKLQQALPALDLCAHTGLNTAFANDVEPAFIYAQQVYGYGRPGDVLLGISTSGNAENVYAAGVVAKAMGLATIALTSQPGGRMGNLFDIVIAVPRAETYRVQEWHLPIYHALCMELEARFFTE